MKSVVKSDNIAEDLLNYLDKISFDRLFILTDKNTQELCLSYLNKIKNRYSFSSCTISAGDESKNIHSLSAIWTFLIENNATRHSLLINLGGGMITDIGGFAAATFKRGIRCINVPTTLLGAVDAAVGGKTGINFLGLKNEIGCFSNPITVLIDSVFFQTLNQQNILSGYAEMIKHSLLDSKESWNSIMNFDLENINFDSLRELTVKSVEVKEKIVVEDPLEKGIRKALNLGHTIGHAFESLSYSIKQPIPHGYAVAWGIISELYLSYKQCSFPIEKLRITSNYIKCHYYNFPFDCNHYEELYELMKHDKKNNGEFINFTLLENIGEVKIDQTASKNEIFSAIDFLRDCIGI